MALLPQFMHIREMENFLCDVQPYVRGALLENVRTHLEKVQAVREVDFALFMSHIRDVVDRWLEINLGPPPVFPVVICDYYKDECRFYTSYAMFWFWGDCVAMDNCHLGL